MSTITILVPCYNEEAVLHIFYKTVKDVIRKLQVEIEHFSNQ